MEGFSCTHQAIIIDVPHQLWESITTDGPGGTPLWLTRMFHNKPVVFLLNYLRCYFHYLSVHFLSQTGGPFFALGVMLGVFLLWKKGGRPWKIVLWILVLYPLVFVFELQRFLF